MSLLEIFQYAFMQRALMGGLIVGVLLSILGVFLILRRLSLLSDGLAHLAFAGIAAGLYFNINPIITAVAASIGGVLGIQELKKRRVYGDAAIAILFSFGLALGIILISLAKGFNVDLFSFLFGSVLTISESDLLLASGLALAAGIVLFLFYKEFFYITLNEESAKVSGLPVERLNLLMLFLIALVVVSAIKLVGILLVTSLAVIPASAALLLRKSFKQTLFFSAVFSAISVVSGLFLSYYFNLATSGAIVVTAIAIFTVVLLTAKK